MPRAHTFLVLFVGQIFLSVLPLLAQQVVDRIMARIEDDIVTLSEVRELRGYQQLVEGHAASDDRLLAQLIEQWIVNTEAAAARYLDYKFRPAVRVDPAAIEKYYREELAPAFAAKGQPPLPLEAVQDQIRELLIQREISRRAAQWLEEARSRLKVEFAKPGNGP